MVAMVEERFLTVPDVAGRLQVSENAVREWLRTGKLRGYRPGGRKVGWRIRPSDLEQFIADAEFRLPPEA